MAALLIELMFLFYFSGPQFAYFLINDPLQIFINLKEQNPSQHLRLLLVGRQTKIYVLVYDSISISVKNVV